MPEEGEFSAPVDNEAGRLLENELPITLPFIIPSDKMKQRRRNAHSATHGSEKRNPSDLADANTALSQLS